MKDSWFEFDRFNVEWYPSNWKGYLFIFFWAVFSFIFAGLVFGYNNNNLYGSLFGLFIFLVGVYWVIHKKGSAPWDK